MTESEPTQGHTFVKDLKAGAQVSQFFELKSKELRTTRSGQQYLDLIVGDVTGRIACKMWSEALKKWGREFEPGSLVKILGRVETFREKHQIVVDKIREAAEEEVGNLHVLVQSPGEPPDKLFQDLLDMAATLRPPELADLVGRVLSVNREAFEVCPAAQLVHHAYRGGLVEHTVAVARKVAALRELEPDMDGDLALAGAILHDVGKIQELGGTSRGRTTEGRLVGHLVLGMQIVVQAAHELGLADRPWLRELEHILLSHHGDMQFGSPVRPLTREALVVHFMDNLDSKLKIMGEALPEADDTGFTPHNKWLEGRAYVGARSRIEEDVDAGT